ncbi:MAG TPA: histidine phosphatase family protein [Bacillota bacterium]|nr:MAG: Alpha-ribazole phosphatase [Firmicutes bacterium ADurb.Bin153]HNV34528.1 histidine phosphatase family protein [Bacillota bacterium]
MEFLLVRHAESYSNTDRVFSNTGWKHGLTPKGFRQAEEASKAMLGFFGGFSRIYSSPLRRAYETAEVMASGNGVEHRVLAELGEISVGRLEGRSDPDSWLIHNAVWSRWFRLGDTEARLPEGESLKQAVERFMGALGRLEEEEDGSKLVIVSHGGVMLGLLLGMVYDVPGFISRRGFISNCDMIRIVKEKDSYIYRGFKSIST